VIRHRQGLGKALRFIVHAARTNRIHIAPVRFRLRMDERISVHLAGGREHEAGILGLRDTERVMRSQRTNLERWYGVLEIVHRACRAGKVQHALQLPRYESRRIDVVVNELIAIVSREVSQVVRAAGKKVVQPHPLVAVTEKAIGKVRTEKAGSAGDQNSQESLPKQS